MLGYIFGGGKDKQLLSKVSYNNFYESLTLV
jgi:hypothetical protein